MNRNYQYSMDSERLSAMIERHTNIPRQRVSEFVAEYGVEEMLPCANLLCKTAAQREKLTALFEFKNLYETVKRGEVNKEYLLNSTTAAKDYFINYFADVKDKEYVAAAYLRTSMTVIATKPISTGTLNSALFSPRYILKEAIFCNAHSIIMAHNHPSGKLDISPQDIQATNEMFDAVTAAGIRLVDHIIVAGDDAVSLTDMGHISQNHDKPGLSKTATAEKTGGYSVKPLSIKEQLAIAEKQLAIENAERKPQTRNHGREAR